MKVGYNNLCDIIITLEISELSHLSETTENFFDNPLKGKNDKAKAYFYLAHSMDKSGIFSKNSLTNANLELDLGVKIKTPLLSGDSYLINLSDEAIEKLKQDDGLSIRYMDSKLVILH